MKRFAILVALALLPAATALAATTVVVHPGDMQGWAFYDDLTGAPGTGTLVAGPDTPPLGTGSANLVVDSVGRQILATANHAGTRLDSIAALVYSTYRTSGSSALAISLQLDWDPNAADADTSFQGRLVYEPYFTHAVQTGVWQTWNTQDNAAAGNWWFTRAAYQPVCSQANPCTWAEVLSAFPNAGIRAGIGGLILKAGGPWVGGFEGNVDALTIGDTTYDFEATAPRPTSKEQCKNGGWRNYSNPGFKNQGECVSSFGTEE